MATQKAISARINSSILWRMEIEAMTGENSKNRILNEGAELFLDLLQTRRSFRSHGDPTVRHKILQGFLLKHFPEAAGL